MHSLVAFVPLSDQICALCRVLIVQVDHWCLLVASDHIFGPSGLVFAPSITPKTLSGALLVPLSRHRFPGRSKSPQVASGRSQPYLIALCSLFLHSCSLSSTPNSPYLLCTSSIYLLTPSNVVLSRYGHLYNVSLSLSGPGHWQLPPVVRKHEGMVYAHWSVGIGVWDGAEA